MQKVSHGKHVAAVCLISVITFIGHVQATNLTVIAWGRHDVGQTNVPVYISTNCDVVKLAGGDGHSVALTTGRHVIAWGWNASGQTTVPPSAAEGIIDIAACADYCMALTTGGSVVAWGANPTVPAEAGTDIAAISAGYYHSIALRTNGSIIAWGNNSTGQTNVPPALSTGATVAVAIAAGHFHNLALTTGGCVIAWGYNNYGQTNVPPAAQTGIIDIAAGRYHSLALNENGSVIAWGDNTHTQAIVPPAAQTGIVAIAAGAYHSLALTENGNIIAWGDNFYGQTNIPSTAQNVLGIFAGSDHSFAILEGPGALQFSSMTTNVPETIGSVTITVQRVMGGVGPADVQFFTTDNTAIAGTDYNATNGILEWADGDKGNKAVVVQIINRNGIAGNRNFNLQLANANGAVLGTPSQMTINIVTLPPTPPSQVTATKGTHTNRICITWQAVNGAVSYEIWRNTAEDTSSADRLSDGITETTYIDTTAQANTTYYYWIKSVNGAGAGTFSLPDYGYRGVFGPLVLVNGKIGAVTAAAGANIAVAVQMMNINPYIGVPVDWWVIARARNSNTWLYLNNALQWIQFSGALAECRPVYQGGLMNTEPIPLFTSPLSTGLYDIWFVVDYPMDGVLRLDGPYLYNQATIIIE